MSGTQGQESKQVMLSSHCEATPSVKNWFRHSVTFPAGEQFEALFKKLAIFVDKTMLIAKVLSQSRFLALIQPRRWGKSTNMNMLKDFFEIKFDKKTGEALQPQPFRAYFENGKTKTVNGEKKSYPLAIAEDKQKWQNQYAAHQGAYPVIYMTWAGMSCSSYQQFLMKMKGEISELFRKHRYLLKSFDPVRNQISIYNFKKILHQTCDEPQLLRSLNFLSLLLRKHRKKKTIILIDQYDCPYNSFIQKEINAEGQNKKTLCKERNKVTTFIENMLTLALQTNQDLQRGILTGISDFLKQNWPSVDTYGIADYHFSQFYGFSQKQIKQQLISEMLEEANTLEQKQQKQKLIEKIYTTIQQWYNGYKVVNPVSKRQLCKYNAYAIIRYLEDCYKIKDIAKGEPYWSQTSADDILKAMFELQYHNMGRIMRLNTIDPTYLSYSSYNYLTHLQDYQYFNEKHLSSFLLTQGYITGSIDQNNQVIHALLPNLEIQNTFKSAFQEWAKETKHCNFAKNVSIEIQSKLSYKKLIEKHVLHNRDNIYPADQQTFRAHLAIAYTQSRQPTHKVEIQVPSGSGRIGNLYTPKTSSGYVIIQDFSVLSSSYKRDESYFELLLQIYKQNYFQRPFQNAKTKSQTPKFKIRPVVIVKTNKHDQNNYYLFMDDSSPDICYTFQQIQTLTSNPEFLQQAVEETEKSSSMKQFDLQKEKEKFLNKIRTFLLDQQQKKPLKLKERTSENEKKISAIKRPSDRNMTPAAFNYASAIINLFGSASLKKSGDKNVQKNNRICVFKSAFQNSTALYHCKLEELVIIFGPEKAEQIYNKMQTMKADPLFYLKHQQIYDLEDKQQQEKEKEERQENQQRNSPKKEESQQIIKETQKEQLRQQN